MKKLASLVGKLSLAAFLFCSVQAVAQDDDNGDMYIITKTGDTLKGTILDRDKKTNERFEDQKIKFINSANEKKTYSPGKIKGYSKDNAYYESVLFRGEEYAFMEVVERGKLVLYKLDLERVKDEEIEVYETQYYVRVAKSKDPATRIKEGNFKKDMVRFCADNKALVEEINLKDYVYEDIEKLVRDYNKGTSGGGGPKPAKEEDGKGSKGTKGVKGSKEDEEEEE